MLTSSSLSSSVYHSDISKCLVRINGFVCALGGGFCCTCFTGGETETHTCSWHHTERWTVQSGLELKTSKMCCHMFRELERKQLKLRALNTSVSTPSGVQKPGRHLWAPAASLWPKERIWFASTAHIYSPALTSPALRAVHNPSGALRHSVGPADCQCQNCLVPFWHWKPGLALSISQELLTHGAGSWHGLHLAITAALWCSSGCTGGDELPHKQTFHLPSHSTSQRE